MDGPRDLSPTGAAARLLLGEIPLPDAADRHLAAHLLESGRITPEKLREVAGSVGK